jgi:hypothetical protein
MVTATDNNLGPAIMETVVYIKRALTDHLLNIMKYHELSEPEALAMNESTYRLILLHWIDNFSMDNESRLYFKRKLCGQQNNNGVVQPKEGLQFQDFYILPKVHINVQLQQVLYLCPANLKDSWHFLDHLKT